ncbi:cell division protein FtsI (penicillin-binding protein 3) [Chryseolinea serpens]|uniref:Cell division protein FtsI (Penicillin-binding protein 3) n=1 Tax=Chryseolinea serpens TaxID=947013 RepID=A0A1M5RMD3_9BACT|nr:penicillin-binding protein [Chryseolinea serpens]SHH27467.1 cell division protein FtsI (penicillin-binding protein 3) [Chryseolinea serpens]
MNIKKSILLRVRVAFLFVVLFAIAVVVKTGHIQFVQGEKWAAMGERISFDYKRVKATRGNIYSDNGSLLATSLPFYKIAFDATLPKDEVFAKGLDSLAYHLARFFGDKSKTDYKRMLNDARATGKQYVILSRKHIDYQEKKEMMRWPIFREGRLRGGAIFEKIDVRYRPFSTLSGRTIGYINENDKGVGLEYSFNQQLGGQDGYAYYQKIAGGIWKPVFDANNVKAVDGLDLQTTLDVNLQDVAETALQKAMREHNADDGLVAVMEVETGNIKAISNLSSDGNGNFLERFNFVTGQLFEPGSTFKLVTMIALLEDSPVELTDSIDTGNGEATFYNKTVRDHEDNGLGKVSVQVAFEHSSNVAMAKLVDKHFGLRPQKFVDYVDKLKLSQPLGVQIAGEPTPKIKRPGQKGWSGISLPWMAYGYGFEITPLHTLALYNAVANGGKMIKPVFVKSVRRADEEEESFDTEVLNKKICSDKTLDKLQTLLEGVVERGTASNIKGTHYRIAGKTGTAQILDHGRYTKKYITSFVGYFPAHAPKYSAIVLIKNPRGWYQYGSSVAAPVFKEIADNIYARDLKLHQPMDVKKFKKQDVLPVIRAGNQQELTMLCNALGVSNHSLTEEEWVRSSRVGSGVDWKKNIVGKNVVPDVMGMTFRDAIYLLESSGLKVFYEGKGRVKEQSLAPGGRVSHGSRVFIKLG